MENGDAGNPAATIAIRLADALNVDLRWLVLGEGDPEPKTVRGDTNIVARDAAIRGAAMTLLEALAEKRDPLQVSLHEQSEDSPLPTVDDLVNSSPAVRNIQDLLIRLNAVAQPTGKKGELARFLGVSPSQLSPWLSGKREPGGDVTLRLLAWVQAEEAKTKSPASVLAPAGPQTRFRESSNEKPKSSPP